MTAMFSYLNDTEKENLVIESECDIEIMKANLMMEYARGLEQIRLKEAELRVLNEGGTYEDLVSYYTEAENAANEMAQKASQGIFARLKNLISGIIKSITEFFTGQAQKDAMTQLQQDPEATKNGNFPDLGVCKAKIEEIISTITGFFTNSSNPLESIAKVTGAAAVIAAIAKTISTLKNGKCEQQEATVGEVTEKAPMKNTSFIAMINEAAGINDAVKKFHGLVEKWSADTEKEQNAEVKANKNKIIAIVTSPFALIGGAMSKLFGAVTGLANKIKGGGNSGEGEGEAAPAEGNATPNAEGNAPQKTKPVTQWTAQEIIDKAKPDKIRGLKPVNKNKIAKAIAKQYSDNAGGKGKFETHKIVGKDGNPEDLNVHSTAVNKLGELGLLMESSIDEYEMNVMFESSEQYDVLSDCDYMMSIMDTL